MQTQKPFLARHSESRTPWAREINSEEVAEVHGAGTTTFDDKDTIDLSDDEADYEGLCL